MTKQLIVETHSFKLLKPFHIAHGVRNSSDTIYVKIIEGNLYGEGESYPYKHYGENIESAKHKIISLTKQIEEISDITDLDQLMPPGAARNAVVNAFWDLESKKQNKPLWQLLNLTRPKPVITAYTLVIDSPELMAKAAKVAIETYPILKLKLSGDELDMERIIKIREVAPNQRLILDANESFSPEFFQKSLPQLLKLNIEMIEQPFKAEEDEILREIKSPIIICADESCHTASDLPNLLGKYNMVNIKLDKTGGITSAVELLHQARKFGFEIMLGCMVSSSLGIEPAYHLTNHADLIDLDAPLLLAEDRDSSLYYNGALMSYI